MPATFASSATAKSSERAILDAVMAGHEDGVSLAEIARVTGLGIRTLTPHLRRLRGRGRVVREQRGENIIVFRRK